MKKKRIQKQTIFYTLCILILIIAAIPRAVEFFSGNYIFGFDQGKHWLAAKSIVVDHKFPLIGDEVGGARGFFQGPGWYYLLSIPFILYYGDPYGAIVLMLLVGIGTIAITLYLYSKLFGHKTVLIIGLMMAISPTLISDSRFAWPPYVIPPLTVMYLYCVYKVYEGRNLFFPPLFFILGTMANFEIATSGTMFIVTSILLLPIILMKKVPLRMLLLSCAAFAIPLTPLIIFDVRHNFLNLRGVIATFFSGNTEGMMRPAISHLLSNHWIIFISEFFDDVQFQYITKAGTVALFVVGLPALIDRAVKREVRLFMIFLYLFPFVLFLILMGYRNDLWRWWLLEIPIIVNTLLGLILIYWWRKGNGIIRVTLCVVMVLMFAGHVQSSYKFWKNDFPDYGGTHKARGKLDAIDFIYRDANSKDFGLFVFTPPIYTYAYDYLIWWRGKRMYGYIPPQEKKNTFYLLAEPDPEKPWTYKGWMETAVTGGTVINTWTLPSGFIVQKRKI